MHSVRKLNVLFSTIVNRSITKELFKWSIHVKHAHRAAVLTALGEPLSIQDVENNRPLQPDEVRIKVHYCSLNSNDVLLLSHRVQSINLQFPVTPGHEFSGEILEVGCDNVNNIYAGDKIVAMNDLFSSCGGLSEQTVVKNSECWKLPQEISFKEAAVLPYSYGTALLAFSKFGPLKENDIVLITVGPAGLGLAGLEIAVAVYKAKVIAICDTEGSSDLIREKGAHKTIKYDPDFTKLYKSIQEALGDKKAVVAYDGMGYGLLHLLSHFVDKENGKLISAEPFFNKEAFSTEKLEFEIPKKKEKKKKDAEKKKDDEEEDEKSMKANSKRLNLVNNVVHVNLYKFKNKELYRQMVNDVLTLCDENIINGFISKIFNLGDIKEAIKFISAKQCTGKVLIDVQGLQPTTPEKKAKEKLKEKDN